MKRTFIVAAVALLGFAAMGATSSGRAEATRNDKVTICHATSSERNPYTVNSVDESSIDEQNNQYLNGHGDHEGDIIPPFRTFPGRNWTDGETIWLNGCVVPPPPAEVTAEPPTLTPPTCEVPRVVVLPTKEGLEYSKAPGTDDSVVVTVVAADGYVLAQGSTTSWTFTATALAKLPVGSAACPATVTPTEPTPPTPAPAEAVIVAALPPAQPAAETAVAAAVPAAAAPTALPTTGSESWTIFLIGLASVLGGAGFVTLSRHPS